MPLRRCPVGQTKRQHTVPRFYLERFVNPSTGKVSVFDKFTKRTFETSVWNIAQERYFYDLQSESIKAEYRNTGIDLQGVEKALAVIEGYFANALDALLDGVEHRGIPPGLRWMLAVQLAIQWTRTRRYRECMVELAEKSAQAFVDDLVRRNFPDLAKNHYPKSSLTEDSIPALHNKFFFNDEHWEKLAHVFIRHIRLVGVNRSPNPLYASDHPVVRRANLPDQRCGGIGIDSPGVEFLLPVSPACGLILLERSFFRDWEPFDGGVVRIRPEAAEGYNCLHVRQSYRHVFGTRGDFSMAKLVCDVDPSVCDPNRKWAEVNVTQIGSLRASNFTSKSPGKQAVAQVKLEALRTRFEARVFE
jgi:hypothetical protein